MGLSTSLLRRLVPAALSVATVTAAGLALTAPATAADTRSDRLPGRYTLPGDKVFPEGVATHPKAPYYYAGSFADGTIYRGDLRRERATVFLPGGRHGRTSALGLKVDRAGRLLVAGGATGTVWVYDALSGRLLHRFTVTTGKGDKAPFLNDLAVAANGDVYITDSFRPEVYRISAAELASPKVDGKLGSFRSLFFSPIEYQDGFNANGIVVTPDQRHLLITDYNNQALYRIELTKSLRVHRVDLGGALPTGDGLLVRGDTLYVVASADGAANFVSVFQLSADHLKGKLVRKLTSPLLHAPSTAAFSGSDLLVADFQYGATNPALPFSLVRVPTTR